MRLIERGTFSISDERLTANERMLLCQADRSSGQLLEECMRRVGLYGVSNEEIVYFRVTPCKLRLLLLSEIQRCIGSQ